MSKTNRYCNSRGWLPDYPDFRDYTTEHSEILPLIKTIGIASTAEISIPVSVDLRAWCPPIEDQGHLGSCTAQAGVGVLEYYERRAFGKHMDASRLFLYKTTRNLLHQTGDTGAFLRTTMGAIVLFGVPPEKYWPYETDDFDKEPTAFCYAFAQDYKAVKYFKLDTQSTEKDTLLQKIKIHIASGLPSMFGFTVYNSIKQATADGKIPYPCSGDSFAGGHAIVAVGYDNDIQITNSNCNQTTTGAFLIRNSWGTEWGDAGYGWLPYEYIKNGLARDWWVIIKSEWVDTGQFGI